MSRLTRQQDLDAVNHYERLKVSQDAPAEVIRAAYRALAAKLHPDRQGSGSETGPEDAMHTQMAALNAAYEVLIDPKLRRDYDATLAPTVPRVALETVLFHEDVGQAPASRVDMDWLVPKAASAPTFWPPSQRTMILGGTGLAVVILATSSLLWTSAGQHEMERVLSGQYAAQPGDQPTAMPPSENLLPPDLGADRKPRQVAAEAKAPDRHRPTPDELAKMSDEELLKVLPTLDREDAEAAVPAAPNHNRPRATASVRHPLDGRPLNLRTDNRIVEQLPSGSELSSKPNP